MASLAATDIKTFFLGNRKVVIGRAPLTTSGGYVSSAQLGLDRITDVVGVSNDVGSAVSAVKNSTTGSNTSNGNLWLDVASGTPVVQFTVIGR